MISADEYLRYCDAALDGFASIVRELGDDGVNRRPDLPGANTAYGLVAHVVGVMGFWARTTNRGVLVPRDRDAEFVAAGTVGHALALLERGRARLHEDVAATGDFRALSVNPPEGEPRETCGSVLLHVHEELAQHLGQLEVIRDVLTARPGRP